MNPELVTFVLKSPKFPGNVGSVARAIKNMGFRNLCVAAPLDGEWSDFPVHSHPDAVRMAYGATDVLKELRIAEDLATAVAEASLVVGTSSKELGRRVRTPREIAGEIAETGDTHRVAIIFGREDTGLTKKEIELCNLLVGIPASGDHPSLNLAQAVMVVAYELFVASRETEPSEGETPDYASSSDLEGLYSDMKGVLLEIGFLNRQNPDHIMRAMRGLFGRAKLSKWETRLLRGLMRQMKWFGEK